MFKCKECGQEYSAKPDYCDCGNDTFDEMFSDAVLVDSTINDVSNSLTSSRMDFTNYLKRRNISVFGLAFFICSVILSFIILAFCFNFKTEQTSIVSSKSLASKTTDIPDIDKLWDDSSSRVILAKPVEKNKIVEPVQVVKNVQPVSKTTNKNQVATKKTTQKAVASTNNSGKKTMSATTTSSKSVKKKTTQSNLTTQSAPTTKTVQQSSAQKAETVTVSATPTPKKTTPTYSPELNNYKIALRSALFSKLSVVSIQGKGSCGIEFTIDSSGKLINRAFTYQSDNKSVNDEVYKMLMRLPSFYAPPTAYKGEKIKMTFSFDNGSYLINYTN